jgi:hypothetical protein
MNSYQKKKQIPLRGMTERKTKTKATAKTTADSPRE